MHISRSDPLGDEPSPGKSAQRVLVIGAGVSGLTTAHCLQERGYKVTLVAERFSPHVTSSVAGALWEWPPAISDPVHDAPWLERAKAWSANSYETFSRLAADRTTGVRLRDVNYYCAQPIEGSPHAAKVAELRAFARRFRHDPSLIALNGINPALGCVDAYALEAPVIDTDQYLVWLTKSVKAAGSKIHARTINGSLLDQCRALVSEFRADAIVNCTGLGSHALVDPIVYPLRGALIRIEAHERLGPALDQAHCTLHEAADDGFVFILPRSDRTIVLGGFAEPHEWETDIDIHKHAPVRAIWQRCLTFLPALRDAHIDLEQPVRVGLRPARPGGVRLEREPDLPLIHNYGHGGAGVALSWGCAREAAALVDQVCRA